MTDLRSTDLIRETLLDSLPAALHAGAVTREALLQDNNLVTFLHGAAVVRETLLLQPDPHLLLVSDVTRETLLRGGGVVTATVFGLSDLLVLEHGSFKDDRRVTLTWSDDGGANYAIPLTQTTGDLGEFETSIQWRRLGYARNRSIRLYWSGRMPTALLGVFVDIIIGET